MTCIAAAVDAREIVIGGDSAGTTNSWSQTLRADHKVFVSGEFAFGFTSSFRMGQLLRYSFAPPKHDPDVSLDRYMATSFINAVRACLKDGGCATSEKGEEFGGSFIVGHAGRIFEIGTDYQVGESLDPFCSVGSGGDLALGAMFATKGSARRKVEKALAAAAHLNAGVRGPFNYVRLPHKFSKGKA